MFAERIALGTAQFGLPYGIANTSGQVPQTAIAMMLDAAMAAGIDTLDTAIAYGDAETRLGRAGASRFRVVTKLPSLPADLGPGECESWVSRQIAGSIERLGVERLHAVLLHRPSDLTGSCGSALVAALNRFVECGLAARAGVSVYAPEDLDAIDGIFPCTLVQLPLNVIDQRFIRDGWIDRLRDAGVEIHARSAFLQGLLLMPAASRPAAFARWQPLWDRWDAWLREAGCSALEASLAFALAVPGVSRVIVGVDGPAHLEEIVVAASSNVAPPAALMASDDRDLIEPVRWQAQAHAR